MTDSIEEPMVPEGGYELHRITIVEYLDQNGEHLVAERFDGDDFSAIQKLGMLEQAKITVAAPICRSYPDDDDD